MRNKAATINAAVPANVKASAAAVAGAHDISMADLVRERVASVAARDTETLAWLKQAWAMHTSE